LRFAFFEQEKVGSFFWGQYLDERVEKANVSIFVDKCTAMFFMGVFQGNATTKNPKICMLKKLVLVS